MNSTETAPPSLQGDSDARLAAIVDSSFDAIISKDLNSRITSWNLAAERLFGYTAEEMLGQSIVILIPEGRQHEETEIIARIRLGERIDTFETTRRRKDGTPIAVSVTISPIKDRTGRIVGASKIARDITATRESEFRIRMLMREVNHRVKNQFAVILSMVRETNKRSTSQDEFEGKVRDRIMALARSQDLLVNSEWSGAGMAELVHEHLRPFGHEEQIIMSGPILTLMPTAVQNLGMALHELGTNSAKYGALSNLAGRVSVNWRIVTDGEGGRHMEIEWDETSPPSPGDIEIDVERRRGFGSIVLQRVAPQSLMGTATFDRAPGSLRWTLTAPYDAVVVPNASETPPPAFVA